MRFIKKAWRCYGGLFIAAGLLTSIFGDIAPKEPLVFALVMVTSLWVYIMGRCDGASAEGDRLDGRLDALEAIASRRS